MQQRMEKNIVLLLFNLARYFFNSQKNVFPLNVISFKLPFHCIVQVLNVNVNLFKLPSFNEFRLNEGLFPYFSYSILLRNVFLNYKGFKVRMGINFLKNERH